MNRCTHLDDILHEYVFFCVHNAAATRGQYLVLTLEQGSIARYLVIYQIVSRLGSAPGSRHQGRGGVHSIQNMERGILFDANVLIFVLF